MAIASFVVDPGDASVADSKAVLALENASIADSKAVVADDEASVADSKAVVASASASTADSKAVVNATDVASAVGSEPGAGDFKITDIERNASGELVVEYDDSAIGS